MDHVFSRKEAANYLCISLSTFGRMAKRKDPILVSVRVGKRNYYRKSEIMKHIEGTTVVSGNSE